MNDSFDRFAIKILIITQAYEIDIFGAEFEQDTIELGIVVDVLLAALALNLIEWRLRDIDVPRPT